MSLMWFLLALFTAFADASRNALAKKRVTQFNPMIIAWAWVAFSLFLLIPILIYIGFPPLNNTFWIALVIVNLLDLLAFTLYMQAIKLSPLSKTIPMLAFTPFYVLLTSFFINNEIPGSLGIVSVLIILLGSYLLNFDYKTKDLLSPFKSIVKEKGPLMMFGVSILWGFTGSLHKLAISNSNPLFYTSFGVLTLSLMLTPLAYRSSPKEFKSIFTSKNFRLLVPIGIISGFSVIAQMMATSLTYAAFVIAVKRMSMLFSSILGWYFFKEDIKNRIFPILLMVTGVILLTFTL